MILIYGDDEKTLEALGGCISSTFQPIPSDKSFQKLTSDLDKGGSFKKKKVFLNQEMQYMKNIQMQF